MIIVNADDFGKNENINKAIIDCFNEGLCSSTTIMSNMPHFEHAVELAHEIGINKGCIGIHLNLTEGKPMTDKMRLNTRFCNSNGYFNKDALRVEKVLALSSEEKDALVSEIKAQINRCRESNIRITHLDSHHHVHTIFPLLKIIDEVCKAEGIPYVRQANNIYSNSKLRLIYNKLFINGYLNKKGVLLTQGFCDLNSYERILHGKNSFNNLEIMIHPCYKNGHIYDGDNDNLLYLIKKLLKNEIKLYSYGNASTSL
ncbi:ChbG/HpnK family deacetylase [Clostridium sp.]|uniref:ChbG/HpnK family deacetylase n=1 Tax=Clostridium sp. TaxID=1506 RepID=UPI003D6D4E2B